MSVEDIRARVQALRDEEERGAEEPTSTLGEEDALKMGLLQPEVENTNESPEGVEPNGEDREYEKLGFWESQADMAKAVGVEALHFFQPKQLETQYQSRTHYAENMKNIYRYGVGTAAFAASIFATGGATAAIGGAVKAGQVVKFGLGLQKLAQSAKLVNTTKLGLQVARAGGSAKTAIAAGNAVNGATDLLVADSLATFFLSRPEEGEGHLADMFDNNKFISFLQTNENDSNFDYRLKEVANNALVAVPLGAGVGILTPTIKKFFKGLHKATNAQTPEEALEGMKVAGEAKIGMEKQSSILDLVATVSDLRNEATATGEEVSQLIIDRLAPSQIEDAKAIAKAMEAGEEIFPHEDGHWSIQINNWEDAYKVSPEDYASQLKAKDPSGNLGIKQMNNSVESTWKQRGLIDGDGLLSSKAAARNSSTKMIVDHYSNKWDLDKKITVKYGDWSDIPDAKATQWKNGNVTIQVNKNSKDIYAALRSELEHARDMIKGEVPDKADIVGSGTHFSRYTGDNEAEMAAGYLHHKSTNKHNILTEQQNTQVIQDRHKNIVDEGYTFNEGKGESYANSIEVKDKEGKSLGICEYEIVPEGVYADVTANGEGRGVAEKSIDYLINKYPDKPIIWDAINEKSENIRQYLLKKHPEYQGKIIGEKFEDIDKAVKLDNNISKGDIINETDIDSSLNKGIQRDGSSNLSTDKTGNEIDRGERPVNDKNGSSITSNNESNVSGKITSDKIQPITSEDIAAQLSKGELKFSSLEDVNNTIKQLVSNDIEISGKTFADVVNDADNFFMKDLKDEPLEMAIALSKRNPEEIDMYVREQLGAVKLLSVLKDLQKTADAKTNIKILTAAKGVRSFIDDSKSRFGAALNYQKIVNKMIPVFGVESYSDLAMQGINNLADVLDSLSLNFTRGMSLDQFKNEAVELLKNNDEIYSELLGNKELWAKANEVVEDAWKRLNKGEKFDPSELILEKLNETIADECGWMAKLCEGVDEFSNVVKSGASGAKTFMVNNVLGLGSFFNQTTGSLTMTTINPMYKILGAVLQPTRENLGTRARISREAAVEALGHITNFWTSLRAGWKAWCDGDGLLTNIKDISDEGYAVEGFKAWDWSDGKTTLQNLATLTPRLLMAEDEFFAHLNYRSIVQGKALTSAYKQLGEKASFQEVTKLADEIFKKTAFNMDGKPLDFAAYEEAKAINLQTPLARKMYNPKTGNVEQLQTEQSLLAAGGEFMQLATHKFPFLQPFNLFIKTPTNIAEQALESIPMFSLLSKSVRSQFQSKDPVVRAKMWGKWGMCAMVGTWAGLLAANGTITGSPPLDRKEKTALYKTGWKPYSIKVGDKYYPYMNKYTGLDYIMALAADCVALNNDIQDETKQMGWSDMSNRVMAMVLNDCLDQAGFRTNSAKLLDILSPTTDEKIKVKLLAQTGQGLLPQSGNIKFIRGLGEHEQTKPQGFYENLVQGYTDLFVPPQDYQRDVFGNRTDLYGTLVGKATETHDDLPEYVALGEMAAKGYTPSDISNKVKSTGVKLDEFRNVDNGRSAYDAMQEELTTLKIGGKTLQEAVRDLVTSDRYNSLRDGINKGDENWDAVKVKTKKKLLDDVFLKYHNRAKDTIIKKQGQDFVDKNGMTMKERQQAVMVNMLQQANTQNLESNTTNQILQYGQ